MTTNEKIRDFRINLSSDSFENVKKIKENIDKIAEKSEIQELCSDLSNIIEVPEDVLSKKFKQVIYDKFDFYDISPQFKLKYSILSSLKYFIFFVIFLLFKRKIRNNRREREKVDLILDNVEKEYVVEKFNKILSYFKRPLILVNKSFPRKKFLKKNLIFFNTDSLLLSNNILKGKSLKPFKNRLTAGYIMYTDMYIHVKAAYAPSSLS